MRSFHRILAVGLWMAVLSASSGWASSDTSVRWTAFSESSTCGSPYTATPHVSRSGILTDTEPVLGPYGTYFGRSISAVRSQLVWWTVPGSGGSQVLVHEAAFAAYTEVAANLAAEAAAGRSYSIASVAAFNPRTIAGSYRLSRHGLGTAIDINPAQNPYTSDPDILITNMPTWFVDAWREAGFCWGGDWDTAKDPMHFSWMGPAPGGPGLDPRPPAGTATAYLPAASYPTLFGAAINDHPALLADATGGGALDVVRVRPHPEGTIIDAAQSRGGFNDCSLTRWFVPAPTAANGDRILLADVDGDSRQDLISLQMDGPVTATVATRGGDFADPTTFETALPPDLSDLAAGDLDGDHRADLFGLTPEGELVVWQGPGWTAEIHRSSFGSGPETRLAVADRDGEGMVELFVADNAEVAVWTWDGSEAVWARGETAPIDAGGTVAFAAADEDGDGRADLATLSPDGILAVAVGNSPTGRAVDGWWRAPNFECPDVVIPVSWEGTFFDDDSSEFSPDIEAIAAAGITKGCNPPFVDMYCPEDEITRGQMAAFLVRALGLAIAVTDSFTDDAGHLFEAEINSLADAGITKGCNPPDNDFFCPDDPVSRGQMAAFLARALNLGPATVTDRFVDDDASVFEDDIDRLAESGITKGCNPPANDRFCPDQTVTRGQMAAFLNRALLEDT